MHLFWGRCPCLGAPVFALVREVGARRSGRSQPTTLVRTAAGAVIVMVVVHLHVTAVCTPIGATGAAGELDLLIQLDSFLDINLFHSDFPFKVSNFQQLLAGNYLLRIGAEKPSSQS